MLKRLLFAGAVVLIAIQGLYFQWLYHRTSPSLWYVFDARFPRKVLALALATGSNPIYLFDAPGRSGYIQALWHAVLARVPNERFVRLEPGAPVPPGAVALSTEEDCNNCRLIARSLNFIVYEVPPYSASRRERKEPLTEFRASILARNVPSRFKPGEKAKVEFLIRNISSAEWPALGELDGRYAVKLAARWRDNTGTVLSAQGETRQLPYDVEPGDTVGLFLEIVAPLGPGEYSLEFDLVQEGVGWFADHGSEPARVRVQIVPNG